MNTKMSIPLDMGRCRSHPFAEPGVGICSLCLRERLAKIAETDAEKQNHLGRNNVYVEEKPRVEEDALALPEEFLWKDGKSMRKSFSLLSLFKSEETESHGSSERESDVRSPTDEEAKFICLERKDAAAWISSLLGKSKSKRSSFYSGRPSFEPRRPSLDEVLSRKLSAYDKESSRRRQSLHSDATEYYSDSSLKPRNRRLSGLFSRAGHNKANVQAPCGRVAKCTLNLAGENGVGSEDVSHDIFGVHFSRRSSTSWAKTLASPLWKPRKARGKKGHATSSSSFGFIASPKLPRP